MVERCVGKGREADAEPMRRRETVAEAALAMVTLPPDVNSLEVIALPAGQPNLGRG